MLKRCLSHDRKIFVKYNLLIFSVLCKPLMFREFASEWESACEYSLIFLGRTENSDEEIAIYLKSESDSYCYHHGGRKTMLIRNLSHSFPLSHIPKDFSLYIINVSSTNSKQSELCVNSSCNIYTRLLRKATICSNCTQQVYDKIIKTPVSWMFHLCYILKFVIDSLDNGPFSE